ncbi:MAG: hypothetical protein JXB30_07165 [Anaerolineae bacterium]|nr:hypothetical protein [Anaerolineae bacterium]
MAASRSERPLANAKSAILAGLVLGIWLAVVIFTATRHEFWRDEVRALSFVRAATSLPDMFHLIQYDGHPILWYLLLYAGKSIVDTPLILPVISITIAFAAVAVFMFFSPFPFWLKCMFIFTLPLYEYSVMARNYGISMLLLFAGAALYRNREKHPLWLAFVLALLANTNLYSIMLVGLITAVWVWDVLVEQRMTAFRTRVFSLCLPLAIVFAGVLLSIAFALPRESTIVTSAHQGISLQKLAYSLFDAALQPGQSFSKIVPAIFPPWLNTVLLYLVMFGLLHRLSLFLAALGSQVAFGMLFRVVYTGYYWHQGLFLVFVMFLYWVFIEALDKESLTRIQLRLFNVSLYAAITILMLWNIFVSCVLAQADINLERSSNKAFGEYLKESETYRDAIIIPEPDFLLESLPYYAPNPLYLVREHRFGTTISFTTAADYRLSLGELLAAARDIKSHYGQPVLIVLGHDDVDQTRDGEKNYSYNRIFSWDTSEFADFNASTILVTEFDSASTDENYKVYAVK